MEMNPEEMQRKQASAEQMQQQKEQHEQARKTMICQVLSQEASARLSAIRVAKPEKAQKLESYILKLAQSGRLMGKMKENELIGILEQLNAQTAKPSKVKFDRRRVALDSDSD